MYLTWIAIIASLLTGIGSALTSILAVKKDYFCNVKKPRATFGQPTRIGIRKTEDFPSGAIQMKAVKTMTQTDSQVWFQRIFHPSDFL